MLKKILFFIAISAIIALAPRQSSVSAASDCYLGASNNGSPVCQTNNYNQNLSFSNPNNRAAWGNLWQQGQLTQNTGQCMFTATISWTSQGVNQAEITIFNSATQQEQIFAQGNGGTAAAPWIAPNRSYRFTLWNMNGGQQILLGQLWVSGNGLACNTNNGNQNRQNENTARTITITSNQAYCVGQIPTYTIYAPGWANQTVNWTSVGPSGQSQMSFQLDGSGSFSGNGNTWQSDDVGTWVKTATIDGSSRSLTIPVSNCGGAANGNSNNGNFNYPCLNSPCTTNNSNSTNSNFNYPCVNTNCATSNNNNTGYTYPCVNAPCAPANNQTQSGFIYPCLNAPCTTEPDYQN